MLQGLNSAMFGTTASLVLGPGQRCRRAACARRQHGFEPDAAAQREQHAGGQGHHAHLQWADSRRERELGTCGGAIMRQAQGPACELQSGLQ